MIKIENYQCNSQCSIFSAHSRRVDSDGEWEPTHTNTVSTTEELEEVDAPQLNKAAVTEKDSMVSELIDSLNNEALRRSQGKAATVKYK